MLTQYKNWHNMNVVKIEGCDFKNLRYISSYALQYGVTKIFTENESSGYGIIKQTLCQFYYIDKIFRNHIAAI